MSCGMSTVNDILDVTHKKQFVYYLSSSYNLHLKHEDKWLLSAMLTDMNIIQIPQSSQRGSPPLLLELAGLMACNQNMQICKILYVSN